MHSTNNEGKSVVAERFIRTLKTKIYKYMTSISKNVYIDKLDDIVNEYNNTYHRTIKRKRADVKDNAYIDSNKEVNDVDQNSKKPLLKDIIQIGLKKYLWLKKLKIKFRGHMLLMISMVKKLLEHFMKKNYKK